MLLVFTRHRNNKNFLLYLFPGKIVTGKAESLMEKHFLKIIKVIFFNFRFDLH